MIRNHLHTLLLAGLLLLGAGLRFAGLTRGDTDLHLPAAQPTGSATAFVRFHPDEEMVIRAALSPEFDLLHPPLTVYGVLPVYTLRGALAVANWCGLGALSLEDPGSARRIYYLARTLAVLCSCGVLLLVWQLGCRYFDRSTAILALALVALAPGAIQQAHFFIVDGFFVLLSVAAIAVSLRALESGTRRAYILAGVLIGATGAVRLNGLLLGLVLLAGHLMIAPPRGWPALRRRLFQPELWWAGGAALFTLLMLEPFLVSSPEVLWRANEGQDFGLAIKITQGEILQPWTLVDVHTTPYIDHWMLWSLAVGWTLTIVFSLAVPYVLWRDKRRAVALMFLWCGLYFLLIGHLQVKAVRYLIPMLPFMALFAGALLTATWQSPRPWVRQGGKLVAALVIGHLAFKGLAFTRIYTEEDSRLQASHWVSAQIAKGNHIGVEGGGFTMQGLISDQDYQHVIIDVTRIFYGYPYLSCRSQLAFLGERLQDMDYIALIDVNRHAQFTAVPELFPVVAGVYERLVAGELGFELVQRFKVYPSLLGLSLTDDGVDPSFLGYDHPAVWIFRSKGKTAVGEALAGWEQEIVEAPCCPDDSLEKVAEKFGAEDWESAKSAAHNLVATYPDIALAYWLLAETHRQLGAPDSATGALVRYQLPGWTSAPLSIPRDSIEAVLKRSQSENPRLAHVMHSGTIHYIPANTALSFAELGLNSLALRVLSEAVENGPRYSSLAAEQMAQSYLSVARRFLKAGDLARMEQAVELSTRIFGIKEAYNILAIQAQQRAQPAQAVQWWEQSLQIDPNQAEIHQRLGLVALLNLGQRDKARYHLGRAMALDPSLQAGITAAVQAAQKGR